MWVGLGTLIWTVLMGVGLGEGNNVIDVTLAVGFEVIIVSADVGINEGNEVPAVGLLVGRGTRILTVLIAVGLGVDINVGIADGQGLGEIVGIELVGPAVTGNNIDGNSEGGTVDGSFVGDTTVGKSVGDTIEGSSVGVNTVGITVGGIAGQKTSHEQVHVHTLEEFLKHNEAGSEDKC